MHDATPESPPAPTGAACLPVIEEAAVLVVDDSRTMRLALTRELNKLGFTRITEAADGREAIEKIRREPFDLVLLDMEMPELDGMGVLLEIRNDPELRGLPVIVISGAEQVDAAVRCIEAGAEDYLPKPFNPTLLRARVTTSLEKKRLRDLDRIRLAELQAEKDRLEKMQRRLDGELAEAANYVRSILPEPTDAPLRIDWKYQPSTELGGDAFGYHWIDPEHFAVYLLDVCGHGVGASLLSVTAINVIRGGALPGTDFRDPGAVLSGLNNAFLMERQNNMYFTIWYGVYRRSTGELRYGSGGHPPSILCKANEVVTLSTPGLAIGMMPEMVYRTASCTISPGDRLHLVSDGTFEVETAPGEMLEFKTFVDRLSASASGTEVLDWVRGLNGPGPLPDDFSLLTISF